MGEPPIIFVSENIRTILKFLLCSGTIHSRFNASSTATLVGAVNRICCLVEFCGRIIIQSQSAISVVDFRVAGGPQMQETG
jgi:hypothetical protein